MRSNIFLLVAVALLLTTSHQSSGAGAANAAAKANQRAKRNPAANKQQEIMRERSGPPQQQQASGVIKHIAIVGERHSGTNFMQLLLQVNLKKGLNITDHFCDYKHAYQAPSSSCLPLASTLVVVMFRNPYDWAFAMHKRCWCAFSTGSQEAALKMATLDFKTFLTQPWRDDSLKPWAHETAISTCDNVMQCRAFKYLNFLNISNWAPNVEFVRHEDVLAPHLARQWLLEIAPRYGLQLDNSKIQAVQKYKQHSTLRFDPKAAKKKSVWFNKLLVSRNSTLKRHVQLVSITMNPLVESMVGYSRHSTSRDLDKLRKDMEVRGGQPGADGVEKGGRGGPGGGGRADVVGGEQGKAVAVPGGKKGARKQGSREEGVRDGAQAPPAGGSAGTAGASPAPPAAQGWWSRLWWRRRRT